MVLTKLRSYRIYSIALFDLIVSILFGWLYNGKKGIIGMIPLSLVVHHYFNTSTRLLRIFKSPKGFVQYLIVIAILINFLMFFRLKIV
jgi:hypothetical protein